MMKRLLSQVVILSVFLLAGITQVKAQCTDPMSVTVLGSGTGLALTAGESHINPVCSYDNGSVTISATGGTEPYTGTGTFPQAVGTQSYTVMDFNGCMSSVSVTVTATAARPTGVLTGTTVICGGNPASLTVTVTGTGPFNGVLSDGTMFSGAGPTIMVLVYPTSSTTYTITDLMDANCSSLPGDLTGSATVGVLGCYNISGKLIWEGDRLTTMSGVNSATVNLTGGDTDVNTTGVPGTYALFADNGNNFFITPTKNKPFPNSLNGVNSLDITRIQQHIVGSLLITDPYKLIAADVNKSKSVTTADASLIQQALLGNLVARNWFATNTWRFVPKSEPLSVLPPVAWTFAEKITINGPAGNYVNQDFIGIKLGDVDASALPINAPGSFGPDLKWQLQDQVLHLDSIMTVEFRSDNFDDLLALQFGIQFDQTKLEFLELESVPGSPLQAGNFGLYDIAQGQIRAVLGLPASVSVPDSTPCFRFKFRALQNGGKLSDMMYISDSVMTSQAFNSLYEPGPVGLKYQDIAATGTNNPVASNFSLLQNRPNPFDGLTNIGFVLPEACEAQIRVYDVSGRLVQEQKGWFAKGYNEREFRFDRTAAAGLLYYELVTPFGTLTKNMLLSR